MQKVALAFLICLTLVGAGSQANAQLFADSLASIMSQSPTSGQGTCRMETGAAHDFCGLPYELSNFQGGVNGCPSAACARYKQIRQPGNHSST
jgi:hypothetical protein